ncbi:hypothetical protein ABEV79_15000 [Bacillus licheniformis]
MTKELINVGLYGGRSIFGGRERPLEASVIYCDKHESCSYFKNGQCLNVRSPLSGNCKFGSVRNIKGYTSRAKKYSQFKREWESHENYSKLKYPPQKLGLIDNVVVFPYPFARIEEMDSGELKIKDPYFSNDVWFIDYNKFTVELIYKLCTFRPQAMLGGEITKYQKEIVPLFLAHLEEVLPERYEEFTNKYTEFSDRIDHTGRTAILKTINPSYVYYKSKNYPSLNEKWYWDGEFLTYQSGYVKGFSVTNNYEIEEIKIRPSDTSKVKITSNDQVTDDTVFVD